jgi:hypothetical protein
VNSRNSYLLGGHPDQIPAPCRKAAHFVFDPSWATFHRANALYRVELYLEISTGIIAGQKLKYA